MARNLRQFGTRMRQVAIAVEQDVNELVKDVTAQVHYFVDEGTPVDTGRARSNWIVRVGAPFGFVYRPFAPGRYLGRGERANLAAAHRQAVNAVSVRQTDQPVYITNNLPYIGRLNRGYSSQSAPDFVARGMSVGTRIAVRRFRLRNVERLI